MAIISAILEGAPTTLLLKSLAKAIGGGIMELRADWLEGEAIMAFEVFGTGFEQDVAELDALLKWADANEVGVRLYEHHVPVSRGTKVAAEDREVILNQIQMALDLRAESDPDRY